MEEKNVRTNETLDSSGELSLLKVGLRILEIDFYSTYRAVECEKENFFTNVIAVQERSIMDIKNYEKVLKTLNKQS